MSGTIADNLAAKWPPYKWLTSARKTALREIADGGLVLQERTLSHDMTIPAGYQVVVGDLIVPDEITLTIESGGSLVAVLEG